MAARARPSRSRARHYCPRQAQAYRSRQECALPRQVLSFLKLCVARRGLSPYVWAVSTVAGGLEVDS